MTDRRFPSSVYREGREPDARFSFANERTFLAWIRTALAFLAGGVALELLGLDLHPALRLTASLTLIVGGLVIAPMAWFGWSRAERALRRDSPLPSSPLGLVLAVVVSVTAILLILAVLWR